MDFYISTLGDDGNEGTSPEQAWKTIARVNEGKWSGGDRILFAGGQTFQGNLRLEGIEADEPVTVGSFGAGTAVIDGGRGSAIVVNRCRGVRISGLKVAGAGRKTGNEQGVGVWLSGSRQVAVEHVETTGFQKFGLLIDGCTDTRVERVYAHENGYAGIATEGGRSHDVYIGYCRAINNPGDPTITNNHSGSGIMLFNVQNAMVEYCEAAENGWDMQQINHNGPVGIWTACRADNVVIQYCVAHHNKSTKGDGGGFDFDGGTTNSIMQYNYSYENNGCGYLLCQYGGGDPVVNNIVRYCVSENDGLGDHGVGIFTYLADGRIYDCDVHDNIIYNEDGRGSVFGAMPDSRFRHNIFVIKGSGVYLKETENAQFQGNCYWTIDGPVIVEDHQDLVSWRDAAGQETLDKIKSAVPVRPESPLRRLDSKWNELFGKDYL